LVSRRFILLAAFSLDADRPHLKINRAGPIAGYFALVAH
jgi:hypothetical protein